MGRPKKKKEVYKYKTFEQCIDIINICINKRKHRWTLGALAYISFEDVAQNLRLHIFKKWHLYDQSRKLEPWLTTVINSQMYNMIRNVYGNFKRPCLDCEFYQGDTLCSKFGQVSTKCDLYKAWTCGKKIKHDIQLPVSMQDYENEVYDIKSENIDIDRTAQNIHEKMKKILKPLHWFVYYNLFVLHKSEEEVGKLLKFKSREKDRAPGYKQVSNLRREVIQKVKEVLREGEIEIV